MDIAIIFIPVIIPTIIGVVILTLYQKDKSSILAGCFVLKSVVEYILLWIILILFSNSNLQQSLSSLLLISPSFFLTTSIVIIFRKFFKNDRFALLLLVGDLLRWFHILVMSFPATRDIWAETLLIFPSAYAVMVLVIVIIRNLLFKKSLIIQYKTKRIYERNSKKGGENWAY